MNTIPNLRLKHEKNDTTVLLDFQDILMRTRDIEFVKACWKEFPTATWTRADGHMVEDFIYYKMDDILNLFWEHDMFCRAGKDLASEYMNKKLK
jgi:hypothetical protein